YHEVSRGLIPPYRGGEIAARLGRSGACRVLNFGCRSDGDYLVALGDLMGPAPGSGAPRRPVRTLMDEIRELLMLLFTKDPESELLHWDFGTTRKELGLFWLDRPTHRVGRATPTTWLDRLAWQLGALRLAAEIHASEFTSERRDRIERALHEAEESW